MPAAPVSGLRRLWLIHVGFMVLYAVVAWDRSDTVRSGHPFFTSLWVDLCVSAPGLGLAMGLFRGLRGRMGYGTVCLLSWSFAEFPALVGIVGFLSGGALPALAWHLGLTLLALAATAPSEATAAQFGRGPKSVAHGD